MNASRLVSGISLAVVLLLQCTGLEDPYTNPENARIDTARSFATLPPVLTSFQAYRCTLYVFLPQLADSVKVLRRQGGRDSTVMARHDLTRSDTALPMAFALTSEAQPVLAAYLFRKNGGIDSLIQSFSAQHPGILAMTVPPKATVFREYTCSLRVFLPELVDSIAVVFSNAGGGAPVTTLKDFAAADSTLSFSFTVTSGDQHTLHAAVFCGGVKVDSAQRTLLIQYPPSLAPDSQQYRVYTHDTAGVRFAISDPDGDIQECKVWFDSTTGTSFSPPLSGTDRAATSISLPVSAPFFDTIVVMAQAVDSSGNGSAFAQCTVFVMDTASPRLSLIHVAPSIDDSIVNTLPCSLFVRIIDDSPIDSAAFVINPLLMRPMTVINDSVAMAIIAELDSGLNMNEVRVWDRAGNAGSLPVHILYTGTTVYRFTFRNIVDRTINENGTFPSINLDSSINIDPPPVGIPNWRAAVEWQVLETKPDSGINANFNAATRMVSFAVPDNEWNGVEAFTFIANWPNNASGYAGATYRINPVNDPPEITWKSVTKIAKRDFDTILADKSVIDPDNAVSSLTWTQDTTRGKIYTLQWLSRLIITPPEAIPNKGDITITFWNRRWRIVTKNARQAFIVGMTYTDTLRIIARDAANAADTQDVIIRATY